MHHDKMVVQHVSSQEFEEKVLKAKVPVVVDMYADWCGPCKQLAPILDSLSEKIKGVSIYKLNVEDAQEIAQKYGVMSIPCVIFFKGGKEVGRSVGLLPETALQQKISSLLV